jgi:hyaluronan synthase
MHEIEENIMSSYSYPSESFAYRKTIPATMDYWDIVLRCTIITCLVLISYLTISGHFFQRIYYYALTEQWSRCVVRPSFIWGLTGLVFLIFRTFLWFWYKPFLPVTTDEAPFLTVVIPAFNEGSMVEKTIDSVAASRYPHEKLEIIVIDDGSRDNTWRYILKAALRYPSMVKPVRFRKNRGKRAALETGFRQAKGEIAVTIDSDSIIERDSLLNIAGPFRDPKVGAVAGKVVVYNQREGIIPQMLHVRFTLAFDFLRASQSTYGTVYCCPGAFSAYRVSVVRKVLDRWIKQTFLGAPCSYGEDRSMTNFILSQGFDTVYQRTALVHTIVPTKYTKLSKMFLRWDRSYIKEEFRLFHIIRKRPLLSRTITFVDICIRNSRYPVSFAVTVLLISLSLNDPATILRLCFVIGLMSLLNVLYYLRSERSWNFVYGIFYSYFSAFTLFWIFPYALFTLRSRSWMTR